MQPTFIEIRKSHSSIAAKIAAQSYREHYTHLWSDSGEHYINQHYSEASFRKEIDDMNVLSWLICTKDKAIGLLKINISKPIAAYSASEAMELERIYILKEASGIGIGKATVNFAIQFAKKHGKKVLWLKAMSQNSPVNFYMKCGFRIIGRDSLDLPFIKEEYKTMVKMIARL